MSFPVFQEQEADLNHHLDSPVLDDKDPNKDNHRIHLSDNSVGFASAQSVTMLWKRFISGFYV